MRSFPKRLVPLCLLMFLASTDGFSAVRQTTQQQQRHLWSTTQLSMSSRNQEPSLQFDSDVDDAPKEKTPTDLYNQFQTTRRKYFKLPPIQVDDANLLFYDIFLLLNLSVSISFWVVHRMDLDYIALAFNEGCLLSVLWIVAGLYHGAFLYSAVDGHQIRAQDTTTNNKEDKEEKETAVPMWEMLTRSNTKGGPPAAGLLALNTFINTISLRLIVALVVAVAEGRPVFDDPLEQLIPLEVGFGLILMSSWRTIHSAFTPRL